MNYIRCCKDCKDRRPACHDKCEKYLKEKKEFQEYKREITKKRLEDISYTIKEGDFLGDSGHLRVYQYKGRKHKYKGRK